MFDKSSYLEIATNITVKEDSYSVKKSMNLSVKIKLTSKPHIDAKAHYPFKVVLVYEVRVGTTEKLQDLNSISDEEDLKAAIAAVIKTLALEIDTS